MRIGAAITGDLRKMMDAEIKVIGDAAWKSVTESTAGLLHDLREGVRSSGMGGRLANTWRGNIYPNAGPMDTAGFVYSKAPLIIDAHDRGLVIRAKVGKYMAIPTDSAPKKGTDGKRVTPKTMPSSYGELRFVPRPGKNPILVADNVRVSGKWNVRGGTQVSRAKGRARVRQSRSGVSAVMFVLVPRVKLKKKLDIKASADKWTESMFQKFYSGMGRD